MQPNPVLRELGYSDDDRVVIIHADDIGFCHSSFLAMEGLLDAGIVSSMAAMVVCPWFPAVAEFCRAHPGIDMGLHFTVNSEYDAYRWGPIASHAAGTGLLDKDGYFPREAEAVQRKAKPAAVRAELKAQIQRAQAAGIGLTHVDTHMGVGWHPKFLADYVRITARAGIPPFVLRMDPQGAAEWGFDARAAAAMIRLSKNPAAHRIPFFDRIFVMPLDHADDRTGVAQHALADLPPGLSYFILHPAMDTPELRAITPDWKSRIADYETFTGTALRDFLKHSGIRVIGWRVLRDWMRGKTGRRLPRRVGGAK
jgi:predicted glycoside hydrolase/deacetylase ChbG (UPF0249 family)